MQGKLQWKTDIYNVSKTVQYLHSGNGYSIDCWDDWFEVRYHGDSVDKTDRLEKAIKIAEKDYIQMEREKDEKVNARR